MRVTHVRACAANEQNGSLLEIGHVPPLLIDDGRTGPGRPRPRSGDARHCSSSCLARRVVFAGTIEPAGSALGRIRKVGSSLCRSGMSDPESRLQPVSPGEIGGRGPMARTRWNLARRNCVCGLICTVHASAPTQRLPVH